MAWAVHHLRSATTTTRGDSRMRLLLVTTIVAVPVFVLLAIWNSAVAVVFGLAALTFVLSTLRWRAGSIDPFEGAITKRDGERRNRD